MKGQGQLKLRIQGSKVIEAERLKRFIEKNFILDVVFPNVATFTGSLIF